MNNDIFDDNNTNLLPFDGEVYLISGFVQNSQNNRQNNYFEILKNEITWEQNHITLYGKTHLVPRLTAWYGAKSYTYSKIVNHPKLWTQSLLILKKLAEENCSKLGYQVEFNSVLINYYRDGNDSMSYHSDDEKELGINPVIASISFGDSRIFGFKHQQTKQTIKIELEDNSFVLMAGDTQTHWQHQISKSKNKQGRINLTFRAVI